MRMIHPVSTVFAGVVLAAPSAFAHVGPPHAHGLGDWAGLLSVAALVAVVAGVAFWAVRMRNKNKDLS